MSTLPPVAAAAEPRDDVAFDTCRRPLRLLGAVAFAAFTLWIHYEVKHRRDFGAGIVPALGELEIGEAAPTVRLSDLDGATVDLAALRGRKVVLIEFWATWCPPCRMVLATLRGMAKTLEERDVEVLNVNQGESADTIRKYVAREGTPFRVVLDPDESVTRRYQVVSLGGHPPPGRRRSFPSYEIA